MAALVALVLPFGCFMPLDINDCAEDNLEATGINVAGVFRYSGMGVNESGGQGFVLSGTITFEQEGNMVRVIDTTYDNNILRALESDFVELRGNRLGMLMRPKNGDTTYSAAVNFVFTEDGNEFCVQFEDTNGDMGDKGSFVGTRESTDPQINAD
jgi:hypothetical protein